MCWGSPKLRQLFPTPSGLRFLQTSAAVAAHNETIGTQDVLLICLEMSQPLTTPSTGLYDGQHPVNPRSWCVHYRLAGVVPLSLASGQLTCVECQPLALWRQTLGHLRAVLYRQYCSQGVPVPTIWLKSEEPEGCEVRYYDTLIVGLIGGGKLQDMILQHTRRRSQLLLSVNISSVRARETMQNPRDGDRIHFTQLVHHGY